MLAQAGGGRRGRRDIPSGYRNSSSSESERFFPSLEEGSIASGSAISAISAVKNLGLTQRGTRMTSGPPLCFQECGVRLPRTSRPPGPPHAPPPLPPVAGSCLTVTPQPTHAPLARPAGSRGSDLGLPERGTPESKFLSPHTGMGVESCGMNSSAVETQEARARKASVTEEALTVDLMDGRLLSLWPGILVCGMARLRSATTLRSLETEHTSTGRIWTRI